MFFLKKGIAFFLLLYEFIGRLVLKERGQTNLY